jgi:putative intracellular protease/amidase
VLTHPSPAGSPKRRALIVLSSVRTLPLCEQAAHSAIPNGLSTGLSTGISTGFSLVELVGVLREFEREYEFTFATPDGSSPQLDVNGLAGRFGVRRHRSRRHARLVERREADLRLARTYLGQIPVSELLPSPGSDIRAVRDEVVESFKGLPEQTYLSLPDLIGRHRDLTDRFSLADFDFVHMPGGDAPTVDFGDNPWMGELLNSLYENGVIISLIGRAPVALTSAKFRISAFGTTQAGSRNPFSGVRLTAASRGVRLPGRRTWPTYPMAKALREAGYRVRTALNPAAVKVVWDAPRQLLTANGPQAADTQAARLRAVLGRAAEEGCGSAAVGHGELVPRERSVC